MKKLIPILLILTITISLFAGCTRQNGVKINYQTFNALKNIINDNKNLEFGTFIINQVKLKKSVLTPKGPLYSDLVY